MALFTIEMPPEDLTALRSWACRLVGELRSLLYALDASNVIEARSVRASGIRGIVTQEQLGEIDISKIKGDRGYINLDSGESNGVTFLRPNANGSKTAVAWMYYDDEGDKPGLHIESSPKSIYIKAPSIHLDGNVTGGGSE